MHNIVLTPLFAGKSHGVSGEAAQHNVFTAINISLQF
jgi:hypothetical protein